MARNLDSTFAFLSFSLTPSTLTTRPSFDDASLTVTTMPFPSPRPALAAKRLAASGAVWSSCVFPGGTFPPTL